LQQPEAVRPPLFSNTEATNLRSCTRSLHAPAVRTSTFAPSTLHTTLHLRCEPASAPLPISSEDGSSNRQRDSLTHSSIAETLILERENALTRVSI